MLIASDYPFLDILWTMLIFGLWVMYIWVVIMALADNFRRRDHSGFAKAAWLIFIIIVPLIGLCSYLIVRPETADEGMVGS